ncbi:hypothetical protein EW145_g1580 [Phellinidium pouzarii]|uniref:Phenylalanine--tRNA ligase beta subunit n=1 Tax=Phellinidium pouzarii TaxID=167371 RepID=A0A4S4LE12_9AGAM|nr:hypothetical protein EW145_g1580 [Phellinidium pouzarii]
MPTVAVDKADLWVRLGRKYTSEEFDQLCFDYGLELDEDTTEEVEEAIKKGLPAERPQLKIEIPANRYDLLCIEGIARALRIYLRKDYATPYRLVLPPGGESQLLTTTIAPDTSKIRPYFAAAILRNIKFTQRSYESFIDLQDKLHQNLCRRRQLVAIGTHDLDTVEAPFRYEARSPRNIKFVPLNKNKAYTAEELITVYESDKHLSKYLHIIKDSPVYPIIYDQKDQVLSMPPIINSERSKITLNTRNVFIDVTATDQTKLAIVVNIIATMFSEYCDESFTIEPVKVVYPDGTTKITPDISTTHMTAHVSYINACTGTSLPASEIRELLEKMTLTASVSSQSSDVLEVEVPCTRPDIMHECDIMEDAAIAYGFNNLPKTFPTTNTVAQALPVSKISDLVRREWAQSGWVEVLPFILCSHKENFDWLRRVDDGSHAVTISNPKTTEFEVVRTSLLPGLLKTVRENRSHPLPIRIFEASDVVFKDNSLERQARNVRHAAAVWCNKTAGFEVVHGLLDRLMQILEVPRIAATESEATNGYYLKEKSDPTFFPGRAATVYYRAASKSKPKSTLASAVNELKSKLTGSTDKVIGTLGILHPIVLENFEIGLFQVHLGYINMPARYIPLPDAPQPDEDELEAAFEASDDEDDVDVRIAESLPLNAARTFDSDERDNRDIDLATNHPLSGGTPTPPNAHNRTQSTAPGQYDFESADYDFPPPGSPPRRDLALPNNDWGNSNGILPSAPVARPHPRVRAHGRLGFEWAMRVLPSRVTERLAGREEPRRRVIGGGNADGVFANVSAKPTAPRQIREAFRLTIYVDAEDGIYVQPEDAQKDAPPSYASAQADSVPPYWETTIHAPSSLSPGMMVPGELPIDGLATGTLFSFLWNMLVSISFQFVGFLLTYLLHTTHAAKLGARAGLGLTLVQYGFALRAGKNESNGDDNDNSSGEGWGGWRSDEPPEPIPSFTSGAQADAWFASHPNATVVSHPSGGPLFSSDVTTEWLAFLLMTIGWFVLLNSLLGFWRIKRWERSILASHEEQPDRPSVIPLPVGTANGGHGRQSSFAMHFERTLGLRLPSMRMLRAGLGLESEGSSARIEPDQQLMYEYDEHFNRVNGGMHIHERDSLDEREENTAVEDEILLSIPADHPQRERLIAEAIANERRLQQDLRAAGLL